MARYTGPVCRLCRREGAKLFLKGSRCYTKKCSFERRPTRRASTASDAARSRLWPPAPREAEGPPHLSHPRAPVPQLFRGGRIPPRRDRREPPADPRASARQRRLPARHRGLARPRATARDARPLRRPTAARRTSPPSIASRAIGSRSAPRGASESHSRRSARPFAPAGPRVAVPRPGHLHGHDHRCPAPRPDAARAQRAARGRVLLEVAPHP